MVLDSAIYRPPTATPQIHRGRASSTDVLTHCLKTRGHARTFVTTPHVANIREWSDVPPFHRGIRFILKRRHRLYIGPAETRIGCARREADVRNCLRHVTALPPFWRCAAGTGCTFSAETIARASSGLHLRLASRLELLQTVSASRRVP